MLILILVLLLIFSLILLELIHLETTLDKLRTIHRLDISSLKSEINYNDAYSERALDTLNTKINNIEERLAKLQKYLQLEYILKETPEPHYVRKTKQNKK